MAVVAVIALAVACGVLSVFVVARRWAFIGEGIAHAWYGGAGTAWALALVWPRVFDQPWAFHLTAVAFCLATAMGIAWVSRRGVVSADAVIGIFMAAALAWGVLAQHIYQHHRGAVPITVGEALFGNLRGISDAHAQVTIVLAVGVVAVVAMMGKQVLFYCLDPVLAEVSGVPAALVHYLLMALIAVLILVGVQVIGVVLVTALLILPGATATVVTRRLRPTFAVATAVAFAGAAGGLLIGRAWRFLPEGPCVVLAMFLVFLLAWTTAAIRRRSTR